MGASRFVEQRRHQRLGLERTVVTLAVDEERRRAIHTAPDTTQVVRTDARGMGARAQLLLESLEVEARLPRVAPQGVVVELLLVLVEQRGHVPETALTGGCFGSLGSALGLRMDLHEGEMAEHQPEGVAELGRNRGDL